MPRRVANTAILLVACLSALTTPAARAAEDFAFYHENVMGTSLELKVRADAIEAARWAEDRVLREIDRAERHLQRLRPDQRVQPLAGGLPGAGPVPISPELFEVLESCDSWHARSGGTFDPRVQALSQLWSRAAALNRLPSDSERNAATTLLRRPAWRLDPGGARRSGSRRAP